MDRNEVSAALEMVLEEIRSVMDGLNRDVSEASQKENYDIVKGLSEIGTRLTEFRGKVVNLQEEWEILIQSYKPSLDDRKKDTPCRRGITFYFKDKGYTVKNNIGILEKVCSLMNNLHKEDFHRILEIKGPKKNYFSRNPKDLFDNRYKLIQGTDIYMDSCLSASEIKKRSIQIIELFGHSKENIVFE